MNRILEIIRIRAPLDYVAGMETQEIHAAALEDRKGVTCTELRAKLILHQYLPVYTLGRRSDPSHMPLPADELHKLTGAQVHETGRAGSVTFHAPGQSVGYLLLNLRQWQLDLHSHLRLLEEIAIQSLAEYGINGTRVDGMTGVWTPAGPGGDLKKICAIGTGARRWVTQHGWGLNVDLDLTPFAHIVPCGLFGHGVTSMAEVLHHAVHLPQVEDTLATVCAKLLNATSEQGMV